MVILGKVRVLILLGFVLFLLTACVPPFPLLKADSNWVQLSQPPIDEKEIVAADHKGGLPDIYANPTYQVTWFKKSDDDYLIYTRDTRAYEIYDQDFHCSDSTYEFKRLNGVWVSQRPGGLGPICVD